MKLLRANVLAEKLGVARVTLWRWVRDKRLPPPIQLGPNVIAWREEEIEEWLDSRRHSSTAEYRK